MANPLGIDLNKFKHVSSDKHTTTLQHKDGHLLRIAHSVLAPASRKQLEALANVGKENATHDQAEEAQYQDSKKMADGGSILPLKGVRNAPASGGGKSLSGHELEKRAKTDNPEHKQTHLNNAKHLSKENTRNIKEMPNPKLQGLAAGGSVMPLALDDMYAEGGSTDKGIVDIRPDKGFGKIIVTNGQDEPSPYADGGKVRKMYANLDEPVSQDDSAPQQNMSVQPQDDSAPQQNMSVQPQDDSAPQQNVRVVVPQNKTFMQQLLGKQQPQQPQQLDQASIESKIAQDIPPEKQKEKPKEKPKNNKDNSDVDSIISNQQEQLQNAYKEQKLGAQQQEQAAAQQAQEQQKAIDDNATAQNLAQTSFHEELAKLNTERNNILDDIQTNKIDPQKYWTGNAQGEGGHSKIMAGLGIILAGFNPTNNPNAAINFLKYQMDQNLEGQKADLMRKQTLLGNNLAQYRNVRDALDASRLQQAEILRAQMMQASNNAATLQAKAAMNNNIGLLDKEYGPLQASFAMRKAIMNLASQPDDGSGIKDKAIQHTLNYMNATPGMQEDAKNLAGRYVPGVGLSNQQVPDSARQQIIGSQKLDAAVKNLQQYVAQHGGLLDRMNPRERALAAQMVLPIQAAFREGTLGTVYREGEQPLLDKAVKGQPLDLLQYFLKTEPAKLNELLNANKRSTDILKINYGLPVQKEMPQQPVIGEDGKTYVQKGKYMVLVK